MRTTLALLSILALVSGCDAQSDYGDVEQAVHGDLRPNGHGFLTRDAAAHKSGGGHGGSSKGIYYHGGPVMLGTVNLYYIFYGNWSSTAKQILTDLGSNIGGSAYEHINTTYYDGSNNHVSGAINFAGAVDDNYSHGNSLADADVQAVVAAHAGQDLPYDTDGVYVVLTSADVDETSGFCNQYCGWHSDATVGGGDLKYAFVGNPDRCPSSCEAQTTSPNGDPGADGAASILAHETEEAISDPDLNAWYDRRGQENADKCAWTFGTTYTANGAKANIHLGSRDYLIQQNWVNASGGYCAMSY